MKKVLALLVVAASALPVLAGAQQADNAKMVQAFSASARPDWGNLQVILLNDRTVEALFGASPAKAAFRTKARMTSVFFIQGTANKEFELKFTIRRSPAHMGVRMGEHNLVRWLDSFIFFNMMNGEIDRLHQKYLGMKLAPLPSL